MKGIVVRVKNAEVVFPRPGVTLTLRLEAGLAGGGTLEVEPPAVADQLREALDLLAGCELYESAATLRREMASRLGMGGGDGDECEGRGP